MAAKKLKDAEKEPYYLTVQEVMEITRYSRRSIERFICDGSLESVRLRRKRLISRESLNEFLTNSTTDGKFKT